MPRPITSASAMAVIEAGLAGFGLFIGLFSLADFVAGVLRLEIFTLEAAFRTLENDVWHSFLLNLLVYERHDTKSGSVNSMKLIFKGKRVEKIM